MSFSESPEGAVHVPVMRDEVIHWLKPRSRGTYIDVTVGGGGHAAALLQASSPEGKLLGIDRDEDVLEIARARLAAFDGRAVLAKATFDEVASVARERGFVPADGILADLGVSSFQLDSPERGFSFMHDGPLDMRMDPSCGESAASYLMRVDEEELADAIFNYGEDRYSRRIARRICEYRQRQPIEATSQLVKIVAGAVPRRGKGIHPATRTFQAIRIVVNDELGMLDRFLEAARAALGAGGRLVVISYHSLEDRRVKYAFRSWAREGDLVLTKKVIRATDDEIKSNPRARSAKLRVFERVIAS